MSDPAEHSEHPESPEQTSDLTGFGTQITETRVPLPGLLPHRASISRSPIAPSPPLTRVLVKITAPIWCISNHIFLTFLTSHPTQTRGRSS